MSEHLNKAEAHRYTVTTADPHAALDVILNDVVEQITGNPDARPRPGQLALSHDVLDAMDERGGQCCGVATTGVGKGLAYLGPAILLAATKSERTVISTESLALQAQLIDKDAPMVVAAARRAHQVAPKVAVLKGWSNYACFAGSTEVLTRDGVARIGDLSGGIAEILDGDGRWTKAPFESFGEQQIVELTIRRGTERKVIETTAEHRWFVQPDANYSAAAETITTALRPGDPLKYRGQKNRTLGIMIPSTFGIAAGIVFGDGTRFRSTDAGAHPGACTVLLHGQKKMPLARYFNDAPQHLEDEPREGYSEVALRISGLPSFLKDMPSLHVNTGYLYGWLAGYFATDGSITKDGCPSLACATREHLELVTAVCARLGIDHGTISSTERVGYTAGGELSTMYKLPIDAFSLEPEFFLIPAHRERFESRMMSMKRRRTRRRWIVESVRTTDRVEEVFCAVVPTTGSFALAGNILTGNCLRASVATAQSLLGDPFGGGFLSERGVDVLAERLDELIAETAGITGPMAALLGGSATIDIDGREVAMDEIAPLTSWALRAHGAEGYTSAGDKNSYAGQTSATSWGAVSVSPAECVGANKCPFSEACKPAKAKQRAADADIVITNHSMLATQAANALAVVIGSKKLGVFDHIIIDEAHALPAQVRSQGAKEVSGRRVLGVVKALKTVMDDRDRSVSSVLTDGAVLADEIDAELARVMSRATGREGVVKLAEGDNPVRDCGGLLEAWLDRAGKMLDNATSSAHGDVEMKVRRVKGRVDGMKADLKAVVDHRVGVARWVDQDTRGPGRAWTSAHSSPVEIGGMLVGNLWTAPLADGEEPPEPDEDVSTERITGAWGEDRYELSVVAVSATLPGGFAREMGMRAQPGDYPSPFEAAYGASVAYIPRAVSPQDVGALSSSYGTQARPKFDTKAHATWVRPHMSALVEANGGSALVLAAKADDGRAYAEYLRAEARGRWQVLSQWDGTSLRQATAAWREDHGSVLVGTRSLMTGVDAPGETNTLVVIDRIPRAPGNPVDDARVEALMKRLETDKWAADKFVYASDAAVLTQQAVGRLIRSMTDSGLVAVLDPRLLKIGPFKYQEQTRQVYMKALAQFEHKTSHLEEAVAYLHARRATQAVAA
jgi:ATP-dependent DNA helicase DinG